MSLAKFISQNADRIAAEWEKFAATRVPAASTMTPQERRDHVQAMLRRITEDIVTSQTSSEQTAKSQGKSDAEPDEHTAAQSHGMARAESGYTPEQMISEFRALRACVLRLWREELTQFDRSALDELTRFNEAVDQALAESLVSYTLDVDRAKDLFLGVLGHDLRTPLGAVMLGATVMLTEEGPNWRHAKTASRILRSGTRMDEIIRDLLDFTRGRLGGGIPVERTEMDLAPLIDQSIEELTAFYPRCSVKLVSSGSVSGQWDRARLGQVLSNLIGNACQHGKEGQPVEVTLSSDSRTAVIAIRNVGPVIDPRFLSEIFEPFRRGEPSRPRATTSTSVGLGLYIAKAIVTAHGGWIDVESRDNATTFTVRLPLH